jgi:putative spermidine/putrescine transport system permease protein
VTAPAAVSTVRSAARPRRSPLSWGNAFVARTSFGALIILMALFILGPLAWLILGAFSESWTFPSLLPASWTLSWWPNVLSDPNLVGSIELSFEFAIAVTAVSALICLPAAYAFARFQFPGRRIFLISLFATNAFPQIGLFVAMASLFYSLRLIETFPGVVVVQLVGTIVFMTWIPAAAFAAVPRSLEEAARDAGAGAFRVFWSVTMRLASPGILVAVIISFLAAFDESQGTFLVGAPKYVTMPIQMYSVVGHYPEQGASVFALLMTVPSIILLIFVRKHIMGGHLAQGFQLR